jgi:8-oxo-dGTP diphosphatase
MDVIQQVAAKAIIAKDGKILLLRESTREDNSQQGKYEFPGGRIEADEKLTDGLFREVREETGLEIKAGEPISVGEWFPTINGQKVHIVAIFYACEYVSGEVKISDEHDSYEWVDLDEARLLKTPESEDHVYEKYFNLYGPK